MDEASVQFGTLHNEKLYDLYGSTGIVRINKCALLYLVCSLDGENEKYI